MRDLIRAVFKTGIGSGISMLLSAASSKTIAVICGPFGIGFYSLLQQLIQTASTSGLATGGRTAMAQGIASREGRERDDFILTAFWILAVVAVLASSCLVLLAPWIAPLIFDLSDETAIGLVRLTAVPVVLAIALTYLTGVLNGYMAIGRLAIIQVAGTAVNALLAYPVSMMVNTGYPTAFVAMITISLLVQVLIGYSKVHQHSYAHHVIANGIRFHIEKQTALSFFSVAGTMMIGGIVASISLLFIRALITQYDGISEAGIFNVAWVICVVYPTVILSSFLTYYLPRLSQTKDLDGRCNLMNKVFKLTTILMVPMELLTIVLKPLMIDVLYSDEFQPSLNVLRWMIVGAYFRATAQVFSMPMLSSVDMKTYFWTGSLQYVGIAAFAVLSIVHFGGLELIGVGYVVIQGAFTIYALHYARSRHGYSADSRTTYAWFIGLVLIVAASLLTWQDTCVDAAVALLFIVGGLSYMALSITREERAKVHNLLVQTLLSKR